MSRLSRFLVVLLLVLAGVRLPASAAPARELPDFAELADRDAQIEQLSEDVRDFEVRYGVRVSAPTMPGLWSRQPQAGTTTESEPSP